MKGMSWAPAATSRSMSVISRGAAPTSSMSELDTPRKFAQPGATQMGTLASRTTCRLSLARPSIRSRT